MMLLVVDDYHHFFLRFLESYLSNGKCDSVHNSTVAFDNCMLRVPTWELLYELDEIPNISEMTVVPWIAREIQDWVKRRNAIDLTTNTDINSIGNDNSSLI